MFKSLAANKNILAIIHRRAGKDIFCIEGITYRALKRVGTHLYLFPLHKQARSVIWQGMDFEGMPFLAAIPNVIIQKKNEARMEIDLFNGSKIILGGSNNYDGLMGTNPVTIVYSEFALHNPLARQHLDPILIQNKGLEIIQTTPRGMNHCYDTYQLVKENPDYHVEHLSVEQTFKHDGKTRIITEDDIRNAKSRGMSDEMIRQEFFVDFQVGNVGAYFTREISDMEREGRMTILRPDVSLPLHSIWDLGGTDATAGILFQVVGKYIHCIYLLHDTGRGLKYYLDEAEKIRRSLNLTWGHHWMPHDVKQGHQGWENTESRIMQARKHGWHLQVVPKVNFEDGIEAMRFMFPYTRIDKLNASILIRALREYQRVYDEVKASFSRKPLDNWAIHIADAFRYLATNYRRLYHVQSSPQIYNSDL